MSRRQRIEGSGVYSELFSTGSNGSAPVSLFDIIGRGEDSNDGMTAADARAPPPVQKQSLDDLEDEYEREGDRAREARLSANTNASPAVPEKHLGVGVPSDVPFQSPSVPESVPQVAVLLDDALRAFETPAAAREFLVFMLTSRPRVFLTESAARTDSRRSVSMFEQQSRCYVNTTSDRWDDILGRWAGARVRHTTPEEPSSPPLVESFSAYTVRVFNLDSAFYAFCVFDGATYLGAVYAQSEASHQMDIAVISSDPSDPPPAVAAAPPRQGKTTSGSR